MRRGGRSARPSVTLERRLVVSRVEEVELVLGRSSRCTVLVRLQRSPSAAREMITTEPGEEGLHERDVAGRLHRIDLGRHRAGPACLCSAMVECRAPSTTLLTRRLRALAALAADKRQLPAFRALEHHVAAAGLRLRAETGSSPASR